MDENGVRWMKCSNVHRSAIHHAPVFVKVDASVNANSYHCTYSCKLVIYPCLFHLLITCRPELSNYELSNREFQLSTHGQQANHANYAEHVMSCIVMSCNVLSCTTELSNNESSNLVFFFFPLSISIAFPSDRFKIR